jgi:hypothetical protein
VEKSLLVDAKMLAVFANLKPTEAEQFRHAVAPHFVPDSFWSEANPGAIFNSVWRTEQARLRNAWRSRFSPERCLELIVATAKLSNLEEIHDQQLEHIERMPIEVPNPEKNLPDRYIWPYQHVVMLLAMQPWRARICAKCGKYFIKVDPRDRYCSKACSKQAVLDSKSNSWSKHGKNWRPSKPSKKSRKAGGR